MSDTTQHTSPTGPRLEAVVIAVICIAAFVAGWYVLSQRQQSLRSSPTGLDGLQVWLTSKQVSARNFSGGWPIDQTSVGLLVVPVYDTALDRSRSQPSTKEDLLTQQDEYDLRIAPILEKARTVPVLVVLPKWRTGMRLTGLAHPVLLAERSRVSSVLGKLIDDPDPGLNDAQEPFTGFAYRTSEGENLDAVIYSAQTLRTERCTPVIGTQEAMLLGDCPLAGENGNDAARLLVLSDPDLLNNHGLRLGDNAWIAADLLGSRVDDRNLVIDYSRISWLRDPDAVPERERSWADLLRFFGPPFTALWIGAGLALALFLWRGALRYGPARPDRSEPGAGKTLAVSARARLLRLSGEDGALVGEYTSARIAATAAQLFGPAHARHYSDSEEFLRFVQRRHPAQADRLRAVLNAIRALPSHLAATDAIRHIDELEQVLEQITHDA